MQHEENLTLLVPRLVKIKTDREFSKSAPELSRSKNFFNQMKALSYPLLVTKTFFPPTPPSGENQDFVFQKILNF